MHVGLGSNINRAAIIPLRLLPIPLPAAGLDLGPVVPIGKIAKIKGVGLIAEGIAAAAAIGPTRRHNQSRERRGQNGNLFHNGVPQQKSRYRVPNGLVFSNSFPVSTSILGWLCAEIITESVAPRSLIGRLSAESTKLG
jgi:hypothetical protein